MKRLTLLFLLALSLAAPAGNAYIASPVPLPESAAPAPAKPVAAEAQASGKPLAEAVEPVRAKRAARQSSLHALLPYLLVGAGLSAAIVALGLGIFLFRSRKRPVPSTTSLEQVGFCAVGNGEAGVGVVRAAGGYFLVGITPHQVSFLAELPKFPEHELAKEREPVRPSFRDAVEEELKRIKMTETAA